MLVARRIVLLYTHISGFNAPGDTQFQEPEFWRVLETTSDCEARILVLVVSFLFANNCASAWIA